MRPAWPLLRRRHGRRGRTRDLRALSRDPDLTVTRVDGGIICTNGPCWSPDDTTFYVADTFQQEFWAYEYDIATGALGNRRVFATTHGQGRGSTVDEENMWNAQVIGGDLVATPPTDRSTGASVCRCAASQPLTFGGDRLDEIYVTSMARVKHPAVHDMFARELKPQFGAGTCSRCPASASAACRSRALPADAVPRVIAAGRDERELQRIPAHARLVRLSRRPEQHHVSSSHP